MPQPEIAGGAKGGLWNFNALKTDTSLAPVKGRFFSNSGTYRNANQLAMHAITMQGINRADTLRSLLVDDIIQCQDSLDSAAWCRYVLQSPPADKGNWFQLNVTLEADGNVKSGENQEVVVLFTANSNAVAIPAYAETTAYASTTAAMMGGLDTVPQQTDGVQLLAASDHAEARHKQTAHPGHDSILGQWCLRPLVCPVSGWRARGHSSLGFSLSKQRRRKRRDARYRYSGGRAIADDNETALRQFAGRQADHRYQRQRYGALDGRCLARHPLDHGARLMAIDYLATNALMSDEEFRGRSRVACLHFASYIAGEDASAPAHATRMRWAQQTLANPDASVAQIMPTLVMDDRVQAAGSAITDPDLQIAVETSVNKYI